MTRAPTRRVILAGAGALLVASCRAAPTRYYTLVAQPGTVIDRPLPIVAVRQVQIAKYLDRPQVVRRKSAFEFSVSDLDEWAEGLDQMATRVLIDDLAQRLPRTQIARTDGALAPASGTLVAVEIDRFDPDPDGTAVLEARWLIRREDIAGEVRSEQIAVPAPSGDYAALASAMSDALGQLSDRLAAALSVQDDAPQHRDQRLVGVGHRVVAQLVLAHPSERLTLARLGRAVPVAADIEQQQHVEILVGVRGEGEGDDRAARHDDAEFFLELADERRLGRLAGLELAAGKLPQARHRLARRPLRQQHALLRVDQRDADDDHRLSSGSCH